MVRLVGSGLSWPVEFGEGDGRGVGAERLAQELPCLAGRHAQLHAVQVRRRRDALARPQVHLARAEIERPEDVDVELLARHALEVTADVAVEDLAHVIGVAEQVGGGHHRPGRDLPRDVLRRDVRHLQVAALHRDQLRPLAVERGVEVQFELELVLQRLGGAAHRVGADVLVGKDRCEADLPLRLRPGRQCRARGERGRGRDRGTTSDER
jgi:hypothetical protein